MSMQESRVFQCVSARFDMQISVQKAHLRRFAWDPADSNLQTVCIPKIQVLGRNINKI